MVRRPPRSTRTATLCPYTTRVRSTGLRRLDRILTAWGAPCEACSFSSFKKPGAEPFSRPTITRTRSHMHSKSNDQDNLSRRVSFYGLNADNYAVRSEEHTSELQSLMRISYAVFCLKKTNKAH